MNEMFQSKEDNYRRDSFEDRFCDDLSQVLLQFLSLEDKLKLEGVSKQFQRTVFQSPFELNMEDEDVDAIEILDTLAKKFQRLDCLQKMKRLSIVNIESDLRLLLPELKAFPALKRLELWIDFVDFNPMFSFEEFKGLSNITHLTLHLNLSRNSYERLNEEMLKQIDINLPNLQYLYIIDTFDTTPEGVQQMAEILSRLSRLETLKLWFRSGVDVKPIEEQIREKCRKIKEIEMRSDLLNNLYYDFDSDYEYLSNYGFNFYYESLSDYD